MFENLRNTKNLLAFSGGVDSSALFFMLQHAGIEFDIAIVDYNLRAQSKQEVAYAQELAEKYSKKIFIKNVDKIDGSDFENNARKIRYAFFDEIVAKFHYDILLTAHQLNDKFEWFLMQLSKGAGVATLCGMQNQTSRGDYTIIRPLLDISRQKLHYFLTTHNIKYFEDSSNFDQKYKRNFFRHNFANAFVEHFEDGLVRSFEYLEVDANSLRSQTKIVAQLEELLVFAFNNEQTAIQEIDFELKKRGVLISRHTKQEILKQKQIMISDKFCVALQDGLIWICPKCEIVMDKKFKDCARVAKIPQNIRPYLKKILGECNEIKKFVGNLHPSDCLFFDK